MIERNKDNSSFLIRARLALGSIKQDPAFEFFSAVHDFSTLDLLKFKRYLDVFIRKCSIFYLIAF